MSPERQRQLLYGLIGVLALVGGWQYIGASSAGTPAAALARRASAAAITAVPTPPADIALDALQLARSGPEAAGRNPFVFGLRVAAPTGSRPVTRREVPAETIIATPPGPPPLPPIPFKFIGLVEGASGAHRIAVLSDSKGLVVHGTEGAIIDGRFKILSIGSESIDIAYADGRGRQTLRLSGQ